MRRRIETIALVIAGLAAVCPAVRTLLAAVAVALFAAGVWLLAHLAVVVAVVAAGLFLYAFPNALPRTGRCVMRAVDSSIDAILPRAA